MEQKLTTRQRAIEVMEGKRPLTKYSKSYLPYSGGTSFEEKPGYDLINTYAFLNSIILKDYTGPGIKPRKKTLWQRIKAKFTRPNSSPFSVSPIKTPKKPSDIIINQQRYDTTWLTTKIHVKRTSWSPLAVIIRDIKSHLNEVKTSVRDYFRRRRAIKAIIK